MCQLYINNSSMYLQYQFFDHEPFALFTSNPELKGKNIWVSKEHIKQFYFLTKRGKIATGDWWRHNKKN